jgi:Mn2+/Fe2+ NRAMP family transporter
MQEQTSGKWSGLWQTIGPGVLYAGAAVGTSHLLQSTRAGASYGFSLIGLVLLVFLFKYPAFEFSCRYTVATRQNLLKGYRDQGRWALVLFLCIILPSAVIAMTALTFVTGAMAAGMLPNGYGISPVLLNITLLAVSGIIVTIGRSTILDIGMKLMMASLALITVITVGLAFGKQSQPIPVSPGQELWTAGGIAFMLAFMGWMPTPIDASAFTSVWMEKRSERTGHKPSLNEALVDFNIGYLSSAVLAIAFVCLGALVMYGTGEEFSNSPIAFTGQLTSLYTRVIGGGRWMVSFIAFVTLFSTVLTVLDGYTLTINAGFAQLFPENRTVERMRFIVMPTLIVAAVLLASFFARGIKSMLDFTTITAFLTAPALAYLNHRAVTSDSFPPELRPHGALKLLSWAGLTFLLLFSAAYLYTRLT